jgi:radical SAM protein with 4Fe4S-binding SPASM domain
MSDDLFQTILDRFNEFQFGELALNVINEPFTDERITNKLKTISKRLNPIDKLFFSSNWLIPNETKIDAFCEVIRACCASPHIKIVQINATLSGIDEKSYDTLQAGAGLLDTKAPYRPLDFRKAVSNVCGAIARFSKIGIEERTKLRFIIKAYGNLFSHDEMKAFWRDRLRANRIPELFIKSNMKFLLNHAFTSFARNPQTEGAAELSCCAQGWIDQRLVVGPSGDVGLCCEDGLRQITIGNLAATTVEDLISSSAFQTNFKTVTGRIPARSPHPCRRCHRFIKYSP